MALTNELLHYVKRLSSYATAVLEGEERKALNVFVNQISQQSDSVMLMAALFRSLHSLHLLGAVCSTR